MKDSKAYTGKRHEKHYSGLQGGGGGEGLPDAERISEGNKADTSDHADAAVGALEQLHAGCACLKHQFHFVGGGVT